MIDNVGKVGYVRPQIFGWVWECKCDDGSDESHPCEVAHEFIVVQYVCHQHHDGGYSAMK